MPFRPICPAADIPPRTEADARVAGLRARIAELETALWRNGFDAALLPRYQAAFRELEGVIAQAGDDARHDFVIVIPVADNPRQTRACLASLLALCHAYAYGGRVDGVYRKLSVLLADDSATADAIGAHRALADEFTACGLRVEYFGREAQLALLDRLHGVADLAGIIGTHGRGRFAHKGQAMMRNIAYLAVAARRPARTLIYTVDADQMFAVNVPAMQGGEAVHALNYLYHLDEIFRTRDILVLTGKVVGDPPVSPAVMAGNFLDDVLALLRELADRAPGEPYRQPPADTCGGGDAAYHDMAELFGFGAQTQVHRYHCNLPGTPGNADCLLTLSRRLNSFFHGEHPTRITWYRHADALASVAPARTVYTGNYVFRPEALDWFIPFAPLRLRMSGPGMGRMLRAELGGRFVAANLPMLHRRTVAGTGASEFRPGVRAAQVRVDLCDEFERQFHGDVMLFTLERLGALGFPRVMPSAETIAATLDSVRADMDARYRARRVGIRAQLAALRALFDDPARWWQQGDGFAELRANVRAFADNIEHHFGADSRCLALLDAPARRAEWRARQLAAITGYGADRAAWRQALAAL